MFVVIFLMHVTTDEFSICIPLSAHLPLSRVRITVAECCLSSVTQNTAHAVIVAPTAQSHAASRRLLNRSGPATNGALCFSERQSIYLRVCVVRSGFSVLHCCITDVCCPLLSLRACSGWGRSCATDSAWGVVIEYRGEVRHPSVLFLRSSLHQCTLFHDF